LQAELGVGGAPTQARRRRLWPATWVPPDRLGVEHHRRLVCVRPAVRTPRHPAGCVRRAQARHVPV